jgi:hypothetical protein
VLAEGHIYSSPAFLGWAAVLVAVVTLAVIAAQFLTASSARALVYSLVSDTALLSADAREKAGPGTHAVLVGPGLIKRGQMISVDLLTDGPASLQCLSPLADVAIREAQADDAGERPWGKRVQTAAFTLFAIGLFGWLVAYQTPFYFVLTVFLFGVLGFATWIARAAGSARRHRGQPREATVPAPPSAQSAVTTGGSGSSPSP